MPPLLILSNPRPGAAGHLGSVQIRGVGSADAVTWPWGRSQEFEGCGSMLGGTRKTYSAREAKVGGEEHVQIQRGTGRHPARRGNKSPGQDGQGAQSPRCDGSWAEKVGQITEDREEPCVGLMR